MTRYSPSFRKCFGAVRANFWPCEYLFWATNRTCENRTCENWPLSWRLSWALPWTPSWDVSWGVLEGLKQGSERSWALSWAPSWALSWGVFVGPLVGPLVDPLVGSNFAVRVLCACLIFGSPAFLGDRFLSSAGAGGIVLALWGCQTPAQYWIKIVHPWVQKLYPVLGLGSGERLLWYFQTPVLYWINFSLRFSASPSKIFDIPCVAFWPLLSCFLLPLFGSLSNQGLVHIPEFGAQKIEQISFATILSLILSSFEGLRAISK